MEEIGTLFYEAYGVDESGRTGVFRTRNKEEIISFAKRFAKRQKDKFQTYEVKVFELKQVIPVQESTVCQLSIFDIL